MNRFSTLVCGLFFSLVFQFQLEIRFRILNTVMPLAPQTVDTRFRYAFLFVNHRDTESTAGTILLARSGDGDRANREPARRVGLQAKRGEEIAALQARSSNWVSACRRLDPGSRAFAAGEGSFPWPSSPGQGKNNILRVLCASVVNLQSGFPRPLQHGAE
jgi:hypothetical protein